MSLLKIKLDKIYRFIAISWSEPSWQFEKPTVLLAPVIRYTTNYDGADGLIENTAIDLCLAYEDTGYIEKNLSSFDQDEFNWRGWTLENLKRRAREQLAGKESIRKNYTVKVEYIRFQQCKDRPEEIEFEYVATQKG